MNINDARSLTGIYARGKTRYVQGSPNPNGNNQHGFNIQKAAKLRRKKMQQMYGRKI